MADKKPMTKAQLTTYFAEKFQLPKKTINLFFDELAKLAAGETKKVGAFILPGIGKLTKAKRKARKGRNPATGETIKIPAKIVAKARLSKAFKDAVIPPAK
ncbi:MAG: HU family DNA-binding protein [Myxococcales bacterium]|nr:HU family DNA-binding protein [Myxococcales bacterium]